MFGLNEDRFQQMLNTNHHSNIYNLSTFKTIQNIFKGFIYDKGNVPEGDGIIELKDGIFFRFTIKIDNGGEAEVKGFKKSQYNNEWEETQKPIILSGHDRI